MRLNKVTQWRGSFTEGSGMVLQEVKEVTGYNLEVDFQEDETAIHKEPQVGGCLTCPRKSKKASVSGVGRKREGSCSVSE